MATLPDITFLDTPRDEGVLKLSFFGPILDFIKQLPGGAPEAELTIAAGSITPTGALHSVDTEADAASDDLANIDFTNLPDGSLFLLRAENAARSVVVKNAAGGAGQILLSDAADLSLGGTTMFLLLKRIGTDAEEVLRFYGANKSGARAFINAAGLPTANVFTETQTWHQGVDVASGAVLGPGKGNFFDVTGTTAITSIASKGVGTFIVLQFDGVLTLTHDAIDLVLPGGADVVTAAGDVAVFWEYAAGDWRCVSYTRADGTPIASGGAFTNQLLHVREEQTSGTQGGTFTAGAWQTRSINTVKTNEISGGSLSSNQITLPEGDYYFEASAEALAVGQHKLRLENITDTATLLVGSSSFASSPGTVGGPAFASGRFTLAGTKALELQHRCTTTKASNGLGIPGTFSVVEVYADIKIWKIG